RGNYPPATGHPRHACPPGEIRWLRARPRRAAAGADAARDAGRTAPAVRAAAASSGDPGVTAAGSGERAVIPESAPEPEGAGADTLKLDPDAGRSATETTMSELVHTAGRLHEAVRRRLTETGGARVEEALKRLQAPEAADALRAEMWPAAEGGRAAPAPQWLEALAASLLADTGAQTGEGLRTSGLRLDPARRPDGGHRATEVETGAFGYLAPAGLLEQVRLSLAFANDAWTGLTMLRNVGQESEWALNGVHNGSTSISTSEREVLETAQDIGLALDRIQRSHAGDGKSSALEQAAIVADAFDAIGPTARATAGWPGTAPAPNARSPEDIARAATVAKGLHEEVRSIADRLIAGELSTARV
ncbi:MAG: hypothetical protein OXI15_25600, partial [Chromatiales bacterium]|nr:hypothetical protein [Chromatiales bacterium]